MVALDEAHAYEAMRVFLDAEWQQGGRRSAGLATVLARLRYEETPGDSAAWTDWLHAVRQATSGATP